MAIINGMDIIIQSLDKGKRKQGSLYYSYNRPVQKIPLNPVRLSEIMSLIHTLNISNIITGYLLLAGLPIQKSMVEGVVLRVGEYNFKLEPFIIWPKREIAILFDVINQNSHSHSASSATTKPPHVTITQDIHKYPHDNNHS